MAPHSHRRLLTQMLTLIWVALTLALASPQSNVLLRTLDWIEDYGAHPGGQIYLDMPEMSVVGLADVIAIEPCPEIQPGPGRLVTSTFQHTAGTVLDLKVESESKPIGVTPTHPFWSVDRQGWVAVGDLRIGERLETLDGTTVVESITRRPELETVYNIEVEGDHVYRVGESGVLVHNASFKGCDPCEEAQTRTDSVGGFNVKFAHVKHLGKDRACRIWKIDGIVKVTPSNPAAATSARTSMRGFFFVATDPLPAQTSARGDYDAGHLVADSLGGPNDYRNLVPMLTSLNRSTPGAWRRMEEFITNCLKSAGANAEGILEVNVKYADGRPFYRYIPTSFSGTFLLTSTSGDKLHTFNFSNTSSEQPKNFGTCF